MSDELTNRTMIGLSPFRPDDDAADAPPEVPSSAAGREAPVVAPVSLSDDDGWDLPDAPPAPAAAAAPGPASPASVSPAASAVAEDQEAASLRGGTMMLSAAAFQEALAQADAEAASARRPEPTLPEPAPAAPSSDSGPARAGTVRLNALDFERLMTTGARPTADDVAAIDEVSKHALGADDLTDARVAMPGKPAPASAAAQAPSVAARVADRRAAESSRAAPPAQKQGNGAVVWGVALGLCAVLAVAAVLFWLFVLAR